MTLISSFLKGRLYLVEAAEVPGSFINYIKHACDDRARTELEATLGTFPEDRVDWPKDFEDHLSSGLKTAMQERDKLLLQQRKVASFGRTAGNA